jgi:bacterioferritin-associated ferredoxin
MSRSGASFDDIQLELGVATQCRSCEGCARELHAQCQASGAIAYCNPAQQPMTMPQPGSGAPMHLSIQAA